jgi:hypothetical protein
MRLDPGLKCNGRDRGTRACTGAEHPAGRRRCEEERGERNDQDQARNDERCAADERAYPASQSPGAVDRKLRRGGAGK